MIWAAVRRNAGFAGGTRPELCGRLFRRHASGGGKTVIRALLAGTLKTFRFGMLARRYSLRMCLFLSHPERALGEMGRVLRPGMHSV